MVDAVAPVGSELRAEPLHSQHRIVKIAGYLNRERAVIERLRKLAVGDLARSDENHGLHQFADAAVQRQGRTRIASRSTRGSLRPRRMRMSKRRCHAVIFEAARGIQSLVLQK